MIRQTHNTATRQENIFTDQRSGELFGFLKQTRRAMLWAIVDKKPDKAADHARKAAHYGRLFLRRREFVKVRTRGATLSGR